MGIRMAAEEYNHLYEMATTNIEPYRDVFVKPLQDYVATNSLNRLYEKASMSYNLGDRYAVSQFKKRVACFDLGWLHGFTERGYPERVGMIETEDTTPKKDKSTKRRRRERNAA